MPRPLTTTADQMTYKQAADAFRAARTATHALPRLLAEGKAAGQSVTVMAAEMGITESYAYRLIRQHSATQTRHADQ